MSSWKRAGRGGTVTGTTAGNRRISPGGVRRITRSERVIDTTGLFAGLTAMVLPGCPGSAAALSVPVRRSGQMGRNPGGGVSPGRQELGGGEKQRGAEVGAREVRAAQIRAGEVGPAAVGGAEIRAEEYRTPETRTGQVLPGQSGLNEERAPVIGAVEFPTNRFARSIQESVDQVTNGVQVQGQQVVGGTVGEVFDIADGGDHLRMELLTHGQFHGLGEMTQQFLQRPDHGEHREHGLFDLRVPPPVAAGEGVLGDLLTGAKTIEHGAPGIPAVPECGVYPAPVVGEQVPTGLSSWFVDREIR